VLNRAGRRVALGAALASAARDPPIGQPGELGRDRPRRRLRLGRAPGDKEAIFRQRYQEQAELNRHDRRQPHWRGRVAAAIDEHLV
jgi:hypothetical protein